MTRVRKDAPLLESRPARAVARLGIPLAFGMVSHVLFNLVDLLLVGQLGEQAVGAAHVATALNFLPMVLGNGVSVATMALISRALGSGEPGRARDLSTRSLSLMLMLGCVLGLAGAATAVPCVDLFNLQTARAEAIHYLVVSSLGTVTMFALMQTTASMRALGEVAVPVGVLVLANALNLVLDAVLLFGWNALGIEAHGVVGAAYATVVARGLGAGYGFWWLARRHHPLRLSRRAFLPLGFLDRSGTWLRVLRMSLPQSIQMLLRATLVLAVTALARQMGGSSGEEAVAALGVTTRLDTAVLFGALGFANAGTILVGRAVATGNPERARAVALWSGGQAFVFGCVLLALFAAWPEQWIGLFIADPDGAVLGYGRDYLRIAALGHPFAAFAIGVAGALNGAGRMVSPMVLDLIGHLGLIAPAFAILAGVGAPPTGLWWTIAAGNGLLALLYVLFVLRAPWSFR